MFLDKVLLLWESEEVQKAVETAKFYYVDGNTSINLYPALLISALLLLRKWIFFMVMLMDLKPFQFSFPYLDQFLQLICSPQYLPPMGRPVATGNLPPHQGTGLQPQVMVLQPGSLGADLQTSDRWDATAFLLPLVKVDNWSVSGGCRRWSETDL